MVQVVKSPLNRSSVNFGSFSLVDVILTVLQIGAVVDTAMGIASALLITSVIRCLQSKILADLASDSSISPSIVSTSHLSRISLSMSLSTLSFPSNCCSFTLNYLNCLAASVLPLVKISFTSQIIFIVTARCPPWILHNIIGLCL